MRHAAGPAATGLREDVMRARETWSLAVLLLVVAALSAPAPGLSQTPSDPPEEGESPPPASKPIPDEAKRMKNPVPPSPPSIANGKELFGTQCAMCHGANGNGKGDLVERLQIEVPDFTAEGAQRRWTDGEMFYAISEGHRNMPGEGSRLPDEWKWDLVNYIRTLRS